MIRFPALLILLLGVAARLPAEEVDRIVAVVDETPLLESEVRAEVEMIAADPASDSLSEEELREIAVRRLMDDRILLAKAKAEGLAPTGEEIEDALSGSIERMRAQLGSESAFQAALQAEGLTLEGLRKRYRADIEKSLAVRMLIDKEIRPKVDVTDAEVRKFFDEHAAELPLLPERLSIAQIFLRPAASAEAESAAVRELASIRERAIAGESFEELARAASDDPSASRGGDLGFFGRGDMDPAFETAAFGLASPGDISGVVKSRFGYHIIQLVERKEDRVHARHILKTLPAGEEGRETARRLGEALLDSLHAGADFGRLARRESDDRSSAARGGEVGVFALQDMTEDVRSILEALQPGEISEVVEATDGFHIFRLLARLPEGKPSFEEAKEQARAAAKSARQQEALEAYLVELRKEIYVRRLEPPSAG